MKDKKLNKITPEELSKMEIHDQVLIMSQQGPSVIYFLSVSQLVGLSGAMFFGYLIAEERLFKKTNQLTKEGFFHLKETKEKSYIKKHIDDIVRHRKPLIENALKNALIRYLINEDF